MYNIMILNDKKSLKNIDNNTRSILDVLAYSIPSGDYYLVKDKIHNRYGHIVTSEGFKYLYLKSTKNYFDKFTKRD